MMGSRIARDSNNKACVGSLASDADEVVQASPSDGSGHEEKRQSNIMCSSAWLSWSWDTEIWTIICLCLSDDSDGH